MHVHVLAQLCASVKYEWQNDLLSTKIEPFENFQYNNYAIRDQYTPVHCTNFSYGAPLGDNTTSATVNRLLVATT